MTKLIEYAHEQGNRAIETDNSVYPLPDPVADYIEKLLIENHSLREGVSHAEETPEEISWIEQILLADPSVSEAYLEVLNKS